MKADACISEMAIYLMNTIMSIELLKLYLLLVYYPFSNVFTDVAWHWNKSFTERVERLSDFSDFTLKVAW